MASVNKVILVGRLTKDVDVRFTTSSKAVANFTIATSEKYGDEEKTEFHNIVVWGKTAENCGAYLSKGKLVYCEGHLQTRKWEDKDNITRYTTEIVGEKVQFLSPRDRAERDEAPPMDDDSSIPF